MGMVFVAYYVGVPLKYSKYRDRIFRVLLLLCGIVSGRYNLHAIRKVSNRFATACKVLSVVVATHSRLRFVRVLA